MEILRNCDRVAVNRDGTAGVVSTITGGCAVKSAIKNKWLDSLSSCSRTQQCNGEKSEGSRKHLGEQCRFELMESIITTERSGFIPTPSLPGTV